MTAGKVTLSLCRIKGKYYQQDLSLLMLTLITWLSMFVRFLLRRSYFSPFQHCTLGGSDHAQPTLRGAWVEINTPSVWSMIN